MAAYIYEVLFRGNALGWQGAHIQWAEDRTIPGTDRMRTEIGDPLEISTAPDAVAELLGPNVVQSTSAALQAKAAQLEAIKARDEALVEIENLQKRLAHANAQVAELKEQAAQMQREIYEQARALVEEWKRAGVLSASQTGT
jgi:Cys-tRNA synthase (O-phospho-L-seryl-tRNA:Cys-tRNA synthase)